jgi:peptidylprolyl isomerase
MRVGGQRRLVIPPDLAYGDRSPGAPIPPNATLVFDITLNSVQ